VSLAVTSLSPGWHPVDFPTIRKESTMAIAKSAPKTRRSVDLVLEDNAMPKSTPHVVIDFEELNRLGLRVIQDSGRIVVVHDPMHDSANLLDLEPFHQIKDTLYLSDGDFEELVDKAIQLSLMARIRQAVNNAG
tara:strand:- start:2228 stop:2629 length:402 start_codon:yes stop_codon:yes gene_type:complete